MKLYSRFLSVLVLLVASLWLAGCETTSPTTPNGFDKPNAGGMTNLNPDLSPNLIHVGDEITVNLTDTPTPILPLSMIVKEDGTVTVIYNQKFDAAGKTLGKLQEEIHDRYVPQYFKFLTVNLGMQARFFSVGGEVRAPNRQEYRGKMTVLGAIDTAGGFTDFSKKSRVQVTRSNGKKITVNAEKALDHPDQNIEIFPGDSIYVPKRGL